MRSLGSLAVAVTIVFGTPAVLLAQRPAEVHDATKKASRQVNGTVRSASADVVVVAGRDKGKDAEWRFAVGPTTMIRKGSKSIVPSDLKAGDAIHVRYVERDGKATAESIVVRTPRREAKKAEAK